MSANNTNKLLSPHLRQLQPYQSARRLVSGGQHWLNANESPFRADIQLQTPEALALNRYPDCQPSELLTAYASYAGVSSEQVLCTRGADEGIELLVRTFCQPAQDNIAYCPPTYGMYAISAQTHNIGLCQVPLNADFSLDLNNLFALRGQVKLVFICAPNNPTGSQISQNSIKQVLEHFADSALVVIDEAYIEFSDAQSCAQLLADYPNVVVLRTLSKAFALAGLRCGFTLAAPEVVQALLKVIAPYPIAAPVAAIACQALSSAGIANMRQQVATLNQLKRDLAEQLSQYSQLQLIGDQQGNFLLYRCAQSSELLSFLQAQGILVRDQSKQPRLEQTLRISVGNTTQNQALVSAIARFFQDQN